MAHQYNRSSSVTRQACILVAALFAFTFCRGSAMAQDTNPAPAAATMLGTGPTLDQLNSLLIFPATNLAGDDYNSDASKLAIDIKLKLNQNGRFHAEGYASTLPAIDRAYTVEESLTSADLTPPFNSPAKAKKIAQVVGTDGYLTISLNSAAVDPTAGTVQFGATATVYSVASDTAIETVKVTGKAVSSGSSSQDVEQRAVDNTAGKIVAALSPGFSGASRCHRDPESGQWA